MRPSAHCRRGFTLLEVMVAMAILAIALTTLIGSQNQSLFAAGEADFSFQSSLLARQKMSEILADADNPLSSSGDFGENHPGFFWKSEVTDPDFSESEVLEGSSGYLRQVQLTIHTKDERRSFILLRYFLVEGDQ
jgi:general secretion pathway protein I